MSEKGQWRGRSWMLLINFVPLLHVTSVAGCVVAPWGSGWWRLGSGLFLLYLAPPLLARLAFALRGRPAGTLSPEDSGFLTWWFTFQLQIVFCRLPALEELLRFVPGLYSQWLRLWGSRIGRLTYWSPGVQITDRSYLRIGDDVIFGAAAKLNAHVLNKDESGVPQLIVECIDVGNRAVVGGYSLLTAGTILADGEIARAFLVSPPFSVWKNGKRVR